MSLAPSRLSDVENSAYFKDVCQDNFEVLAADTAKREPTYANGSPTTIIGPPTSGTHVLDEFWRDAQARTFHQASRRLVSGLLARIRPSLGVFGFPMVNGL